MLITTPQDPGRLRELTRQIGLRLRTRTADISDGMTAAIEEAIGELDDDDETHASLHASVTNNVEVIIDLLVNARAPHDLPPVPDAIRYAVDLARQGVASAPLRRAYHVGSDHLLAHVFDQVREVGCEPDEQLPLYHHLAGWIFQYIDEITRMVIAAHDVEVQSSHSRAARSINSLVLSVLRDEDTDPVVFESTTGYRLNQVHLGCRVWIDDFGSARDQERLLTDVVDSLVSELAPGQAPLTVISDRATAEVWFGWDRRRRPPLPSTIAPIAAATPRARIAFGAPAVGVDGFRTTRAQATQAALVARASTSDKSHVVAYSSDGIPVIARLASDLPATRLWVREVLGELAEDTDDAARQRETVRVFLETAENYTETATRLMLHRNSVKYRLTKAEETLGRELGLRRLDTHLALTTCEVLGDAVLIPARG